MDISTTEQLTGLRDSLRRNGSRLDLESLKRLMDYYLVDRDLRRKLMDTNSIAMKAIWYCLCNNNTDRDELIGKLYNYFKINGESDEDALYLVSVVLFLGDVDFQMNEIEKPIRQHLQTTDDTTGSGKFPSGNTHVTPTKPEPKPKILKWVVALVAFAIAVAVVLVARFCFSGGYGGEQAFDKSKLCGIYGGTIEQKGVVKTYRLSVSLTDEKLQVGVFNIHEPDDMTIYPTELKGDKLRLKNGPDLTVSNGNKGRIKLSYEDEKNERKWKFVSK